MRYILGVDIGTTAIKTALIGEDGQVARSATSEYELITLPNGGVEQELDAYVAAFRDAVERVTDTEAITKKEIVCMGFSSTQETCVLLDENHKALRPVMAWMDTRATAEADELNHAFDAAEIFAKVGWSQIAAIHPASKVLWIKRNEPELFAKAAKILQIKDYFIYRLTGQWLTDESTASDHGFFDIGSRQYWPEMMELIGIKREQLPDLQPPGVNVGIITSEAAEEFGLNPEMMINLGTMDQSCGAIGAGNIRPGIASESTGSALVTVATVDALNMRAADVGVPACCSGIPGKYMYQPYCTGSMIMKWFRDSFCVSEKEAEAQGGENAYAQMDALVRETMPGADGLLMLPYFQGSGVPEMNEHADGVYYGIKASHTKGHFIRAIMEGLSIALKRMLECEQELGASMTEIRSLGGGAKSAVWCQIKADILGVPVRVIKNSESCPSMGAAFLAGVASGIWPSVEEATEKFVAIEKTYLPNPENKEVYSRLYDKYVEVTQVLEKTFY